MKKLETMNLRNIFKAFIEMKTNVNLSRNSYKVKKTFAWVHETLRAMEDEGLIKIVERDRRSKGFKYTKKGKKFRKKIVEIYNMMKEG